MQTISTFLYNAAFAVSEEKHDVQRGNKLSVAWFFFVACALSIFLRTLDHWFFTEEDASTSEFCALGAFAIGGMVSFRSRNFQLNFLQLRRFCGNMESAAAYGLRWRAMFKTTLYFFPLLARRKRIIPVVEVEQLNVVSLHKFVISCLQNENFTEAESAFARFLSTIDGSCVEFAELVVISCLDGHEQGATRAGAWMLEIIAKGVHISPATTKLILNAHIKNENPKAAKQLFLQLVDESIVDQAGLEIVLENCIPATQIIEFQTLFAKINDGYLAVIRNRVRHGNVVEAEFWLQRAIQASVANCECFNWVICACARCGNVSRADEWLQKMETLKKLQTWHDDEMKANSYFAVIDGFAQRGDLKRSGTLVQQAMNGGIVFKSSGVFNSLMKGFARNNNFIGANNFLEIAKRRCLMRDALGYHVMIAASARAGEPVIAENWLHNMMEDMHVPDVVNFNSIINAWAKRGAAGAAERLVREMYRVGAEPDVVTLGVAVHCCARFGNVVCAEAILNLITFRSKIQPDVICYNALIDTCVKANQRHRAEAWLSKMIDDGMQPTVVTYTTIIHAHARNGDIDAAERSLERMFHAKIEANVVSYSALIGACAKIGDIERAEKWFHRMKVVGIQGNTVSYSVLLNVCAKAGDYQRAEKWLHAMFVDGIAPNVVCFNNVIDACVKAGLAERAEMWLSLMGRQFNENTCGSIVCELQEVAMNVRPTRQSFTTAAQAYACHGAWLETERIMQEMTSQGITMDEFSITVLLSAYSRARPRQRDRAELAFRRHAAEGLPITKPPLRVLRSLIGAAKFEDCCKKMKVSHSLC